MYTQHSIWKKIVYESLSLSLFEYVYIHLQSELQIYEKITESLDIDIQNPQDNMYISLHTYI